MGRVSVYNFLTLDGYFQGPQGDLSWHQHGEEENEYAAEMLKTGSTLLFGRVTYDMMVSYWPTPKAKQDDPAVAEGMNKAEKIVFSKTLEKVDWSHARVARDLEGEVKRLKEMPGKDMTLLGSGSILTQLAEKGLIDEFQIMVDPVALGDGTSIFKGIHDRLYLKLLSAKAFKSGVVLLRYQPGEKKDTGDSVHS